MGNGLVKLDINIEASNLRQRCNGFYSKSSPSNNDSPRSGISPETASASNIDPMTSQVSKRPAGAPYFVMDSNVNTVDDSIMRNSEAVPTLMQTGHFNNEERPKLISDVIAGDQPLLQKNKSMRNPRPNELN